MKNKIITTGLLIIITLTLLGVIVIGSRNSLNSSSNKPSSTQINNIDRANSDITFFYGDTCPHCAEVESWIKENKIEEKIKIVKKEVYDNKQNAQELEKAATSCGLPTDSIGVPFLYAEGKCFIGTPDVINYLSQKAGIKSALDSIERNAK